MKPFIFVFFGFVCLPSITFACVDGEVRTSNMGQKFYCDHSYPKLGNDAIRDPSGLIWGEVPQGNIADPNTDDDGYLTFSEPDAVKYCKQIGARLPTAKQYAALRDYLGYDLYYKESGWHNEMLSPSLYQETWTSTPWTQGNCSIGCSVMAKLYAMSPEPDHFPPYLTWYQSMYSKNVRCVAQSPHKANLPITKSILTCAYHQDEDGNITGLNKLKIEINYSTKSVTMTYARNASSQIQKAQMPYVEDSVVDLRVVQQLPPPTVQYDDYALWMFRNGDGWSPTFYTHNFERDYFTDFDCVTRDIQ